MPLIQFIYETLTEQHLPEVINLLTRTLSTRESLYSMMAIPEDEIRLLNEIGTRLILPEKLSMVAIDSKTKKVVGCIILCDWLTDLSSVFVFKNEEQREILTAMSTKIAEEITQWAEQEIGVIKPGEIAYGLMMAVDENYTRQKIGAVLLYKALCQLGNKGFKFTVGEVSSDYSSRYLQRLLHKNLITLHYNEITYAGKKPFANSYGKIDVTVIETPIGFTEEFANNLPLLRTLGLYNNNSPSSTTNKFATSTSNIVYEVLNSTHLAEAHALLAEAFYNRESFFKMTGLSQQEVSELIKKTLDIVMPQQLSLVAIDKTKNNKIVGCIVNCDFLTDLTPTYQTLDSHKKALMMTWDELIEKHVDIWCQRENIELKYGNVAHGLMSAVDETSTNQRIGSILFFKSFFHLGAQKYEYSIAEIISENTVKQSKHIMQEEICCIDYNEFEFNNTKPFKNYSGKSRLQIAPMPKMLENSNPDTPTFPRAKL